MDKDKWEQKYRKHLAQIEKRIDDIFATASDEAAKIAASIKGAKAAKTAKNKAFNFNKYPQANARINKLSKDLRDKLKVTIVNGVDNVWGLSNQKNNALCNAVFGHNLGELSGSLARSYYTDNYAAHEAFLQREIDGLNLSDRVWKYSKQFKTDIEYALDYGISNGESAQELSRDLKQYLQNPNKVFRRVRDANGELQLSKPARAYHSGQGVYRSSHLNALRLARTEVNTAYRSSDYLRWSKFDFVVGITIHLSNNHTTLRNGHKYPLQDICDVLQGDYPKDFKFVGWHPNCRCYQTSILKSAEELDEDDERMRKGLPPLAHSVNEVKDVPPQFKEYIESNKGRILASQNLPYFVKDNLKYVDVDASEIALNSEARNPDLALNLKIDKLLDKYGVPHTTQVVHKASAKEFHNAIAAEKEKNKNGWMVDVHELKEYKDMKCFMTADGKSGIAVKSDGDVVSLFSSVKGDKRMEKLIPVAIYNGGCKLDCYGGGLQSMYARFGFEAFGKVGFVKSYAPEGWDGKSEYPVIAMYIKKKVAQSVKSYNHFAEINPDDVEDFSNIGYDALMKLRDKKLLEHN